MNAKQDAVLVTNELGEYDIQIGPNGDILTEDFFETSLLGSIYGEKRASKSEITPSHLRRGWIGNESGNGFERGSKLWLYQQSRLTRDVLNKIEKAANDSLKWFVTDKILISISATATLQDGAVTLIIDINRSGSQVDRRYFKLWENTGVM